MHVEKLLEAVNAGVEAIRRTRSDSMAVSGKGERDLVTEADCASQEAILAVLRKLYPDTPIVAEEQEKHEIIGDTYLTVDPIDGTYNFLHGTPDWGVTAALIERGAPIAGVILLPDHNCVITAERGHGCYLNGKRWNIAPKGGELKRCLVGVEIGWFVGVDRIRKKIVPIVERVLSLRCVLCAVASVREFLLGYTAAYVNFHGSKVWDFAAAVVAVEESGGVARSVKNEPLQWNEVYMSAAFAADSSVLEELLSPNTPSPAS